MIFSKLRVYVSQNGLSLGSDQGTVGDLLLSVGGRPGVVYYAAYQRVKRWRFRQYTILTGQYLGVELVSVRLGHVPSSIVLRPDLRLKYLDAVKLIGQKK